MDMLVLCLRIMDATVQGVLHVITVAMILALDMIVTTIKVTSHASS
jgi:hypothetical protein